MAHIYNDYLRQVEADTQWENWLHVVQYWHNHSPVTPVCCRMLSAIATLLISPLAMTGTCTDCAMIRIASTLTGWHRCAGVRPWTVIHDTPAFTARRHRSTVSLTQDIHTKYFQGRFLSPHSRNFPKTFSKDDLGILKKFSVPNSQRLSLCFQRTSSFLISVTSSTNQMHLYRPRDVSTRVLKLLRKKSLENFLSWYVDGKHNLHTATLFKLIKCKFALLTHCRFNSNVK